MPADSSITETKPVEIEDVEAELQEDLSALDAIPRAAALSWNVGRGSSSQRVRFRLPASVTLDQRTTKIFLSVRHGNPNENPNHADSFVFRIDKISSDGKEFYAYMRRVDSRNGYAAGVRIDGWLLNVRT